MPSFVCSNLPVCSSAGATVQLGDSCWATRAGVTLTYEVAGRPATSAVCPAAAGSPLAVKVKAQIAGKPGCAFGAADAFSLVSECAGWAFARARLL